MSKKIMVVDDAAFMRYMLKDILEGAGYNVIAEAENGVIAIETYKKFINTDKKIDLILLDITMPEMDGLTALGELKKFDPNTKVIMCTAISHQSHVVKALGMGADGYISKPFEKSQVLNMVKSVIS